MVGQKINSRGVQFRN